MSAERVHIKFVGDSIERIFVRSPRERTMEALRALGVVPVLSSPENLPEASYYLLIRGDHLFDPRLLAALLDCEAPCRFTAPGSGEILLEKTVIAANGPVRALDISKLDDYVPKLRHHVPYYWLPVRTRSEARHAEQVLIASNEKDPSDLMARFVHRPIENWVVARLAHTAITPNQITLAINLLAYLATALFATGHLLSASLLTLIVGLLDGFDGKLARVKGLTSRVGSLEHAFDLLFESSWVLALGYYCALGAGMGPLWLAGLSVALFAFYRSIYERFGQVFQMSLDVCDRFGNVFRRIAGRRNLYNVEILAFILAGWPLGALYSIAVHAAVTALIYGARAWWKLRWLDL
jgi:phosphatidylglycerophosphate synthase